MNVAEFKRALIVLQDAFPKWDLNENQARTWAVLMSDLPDGSALHAAVEMARESEFPPKVAEWRRRALKASGTGPLHRQTDCDAWDELQRNRGLYARLRHEQREEKAAEIRSKIVWSSEAVHRAAEAVGWKSGAWKDDSIPTIRAHFNRYHAALVKKTDEFDATSSAGQLLGGITRALAERWKPQITKGGDS